MTTLLWLQPQPRVAPLARLSEEDALLQGVDELERLSSMHRTPHEI
jgi:hypothetical protein